MNVDDLLFTLTLGACGTDIVGIENLKHIGSGVTHKSSDRENDKNEHGKRKVVKQPEQKPAAPAVSVAPALPEEPEETVQEEAEPQADLESRPGGTEGGMSAQEKEEAAAKAEGVVADMGKAADELSLAAAKEMAGSGETKKAVMRARAEKRMDEAVALIVERIVKG